jgi:DNA-directed RNA polymerase specialized sigma subunit
MNPIDDYFVEKSAAAQRRVEDDHALVNQWQQAHQGDSFDPDLTHQALQRFQPTIQTAIKMYGGPKSNLEAPAKLHAIEALRTFDPTKGATFNTHLTNKLRRLQRENARGQVSYIPEEKASYIGPAQRARDEFQDEFGREPTPQEHEQYLNESLPANRRLQPGQLGQIQSLQRSVIPSSTFEGQPNTFHQDLEQQNVALARYDLQGQHRNVYDLIYRDNITSTSEIARRLGMSDAAVSRAKNKIEQTITGGPVTTRKRASKKTGF